MGEERYSQIECGRQSGITADLGGVAQWYSTCRGEVQPECGRQAGITVDWGRGLSGRALAPSTSDLDCTPSAANRTFVSDECWC